MWRLLFFASGNTAQIQKNYIFLLTNRQNCIIVLLY